MARVALSFDAWKDGQVAPAVVEVPVIVHKVVPSPELTATLRGHGETVWKVAVSTDGKTLASGTYTGEVKLWGVERKQERGTLANSLGNSYSLAFSPDGRTLAVGHYHRDEKGSKHSGGIVLWDVATMKEKVRLQHTPPLPVSQVIFSPDGATIAAFESRWEGEKPEYRGQVAIWDVATGKVRSTIALPQSGNGLSFSPDGKTLVLSAMIYEGGKWLGSQVRRWDVGTGKELPAWPNPPGHNGVCQALAFSPDGRLLAGCDHAGNVHLWDAEKGAVRATWRVAQKRPLRSAVFSPDGRTLAVAAGNPGRDPEPGVVVLWDVKEGRQVAALTGHLGEALCVAFSPDGKTLVSGGGDKTVRLWDVSGRR